MAASKMATTKTANGYAKCSLQLAANTRQISTTRRAISFTNLSDHAPFIHMADVTRSMKLNQAARQIQQENENLTSPAPAM